MVKNVYLGFFDKFNLLQSSHTDGYIFVSAHYKHVPCNTLTDSTNEDLLNIKRKDDTKSRTLSRTSDTTETRNPRVIKVILLACSTYIAIFKFYQISSDTLTSKKNSARKLLLRSRIERQFDWMRLDSTLKKSSPIYLSPNNIAPILMHWMSVKLADKCQIREHSWPCLFHIINS